MKWGILATGNIAGKFASTIRQMEGEGQTLAAVGPRPARGRCAGRPRFHVTFLSLHNRMRGSDPAQAPG